MSYSDIHGHRSMVFDDLRNRYYANAIKKIINKDSVVLDLGAGLGLLGLMALSAGAKKVYLVEPSPTLEVAKMLIKANNLSDRIECISGKIEDIELPEKVDVIISVFTGNFLLSEDLLPSLFYARDKYLRPGGKLIPDRAKMIAVPVTASKYYAKEIDCWTNPAHNIDFSLARRFATNNMYYDDPKRMQAEFLGEPSEILELDFMKAKEASCQSQTEVEVSQDGILHGWVGWFDARVGNEWLSTSPLGKQMHWSQAFLPLSEPIQVKKSEKVVFELNRPEFGEWSWIVGAGGKRQKHSTFLSRVISPSEVIKRANRYKPELSEQGKATLEVLQLSNGTLPLLNIVQKIIKDYPSLFATPRQTEKFVKNLVEELC